MSKIMETDCIFLLLVANIVQKTKSFLSAYNFNCDLKVLFPFTLFTND